MRLPVTLPSALLALALPLSAAEGLTAVQAAKLLPKDAWGRLARVAAFEGGPAPERWHLLVHDTKEENGLHEYVVAHGEVVASRSVSQFAEELKQEDVIGLEAVKIDSDKAVAVAKQYAEANKLPSATYNYELKKDGDGAVPMWRVTCVDAKGDELGQILMTASKGNVLGHEGFALEPTASDKKQELALAEAQYQKEKAAYREKQARKAAAATANSTASASPAPAVSKPPTPVPAPAASKPPTSAPAPAERPARVAGAPPRPVATPLKNDEWVGEEPRKGLLQRAGSSVGRIFGGGR